MQITLVAFGIAKDILGVSRKAMAMPSGQSVGEAKRILVDEHPQLKELATIRFAINENYCDDQAVLKDGDELVIIPPVSGG